MATGRFLNDGAIGTLTVSGMDGTNDRWLVHDASAGAAKQVAASQLLNRLMSTADISWMGALANMAAIDAANDKFVVWDTSATAWKTLPAQEIVDRILTTADVSALAALSNWSDLDHAADKLLVWDNSAAAFKTLLTSKVQERVWLFDETDYTSTPQTLSASDSGKLCRNALSVVDITFTLPTAAAGLRIAFYRQAAQLMRIVPFDSSDYIGEGGGGKYLDMLTRGYLELQVLSGTSYWSIVTATCLYEYEP